ncbi:hypothetical protein [Vibrio metoecus]|uniref:hypothetical protein n=1 Tax=Vibrio metoecus TaxID=1481663 RepID=UPI0006D7EF31|nr:hypothetical protein [Vibrio metoecus]KQA18591.1 hypothetical protein AAY52_09075 [Vibrio metoecus]
MNRNKVVVKPLKQGNFFIKTPDEVAEMFGFCTSARSKLKLSARMLGKEIKLSDRSLDNLSSRGISEKKAKECLEPIISAFEERFAVDLDDLIPVGAKISDLEVLWQATCFTFLKGANFLDSKEECLRPLIMFIERRCREYKPQQRLIAKIQDCEPDDAIRHVVDFYRPIIDKTMLSKVQQAIVIDFLSQLPARKSFQLNTEETEALCLFIQDFNLSLFAAIDLVIVEMNQQGNELKVNKGRSLLADILDADGICYFGKLITFIKEKTGISYSKLAKFIPVHVKDAASGRSISDAQKERLTEWRKGEVKPSFKALNEFFSHFDADEQFPLLVYSFICMAIDKILTGFVLENERELLNEIYSSKYYIRYYEREMASC